MSEQEQAQPTEEQVELHKSISEGLTTILGIPANQLSMGIMFFEVALQAMKLQQQEEERRYARPVLVRTEYEGSLKAVVSADPANAGEFIVDLFDLKDGEWVDLDFEPSYLEVLSKMVLSQSVQDGDVWYITNNAAIEANLEKVADVYASKLK